LATRYHPDHHQGNELEDLAREKLTQLNEAYETLKDPARRSAYDLKRRGYNGQSSPPPYSTATPQPQIHLAKSLKSSLLLMAVLVGLPLLAGRFGLRSTLIIGGTILLARFGPRLWRFVKGKK
jgi:curved DNA-binding protein CbpA